MDTEGLIKDFDPLHLFACYRIDICVFMRVCLKYLVGLLGLYVTIVCSVHQSCLCMLYTWQSGLAKLSLLCTYTYIYTCMSCIDLHRLLVELISMFCAQVILPCTV